MTIQGPASARIILRQRALTQARSRRSSEFVRFHLLSTETNAGWLSEIRGKVHLP
jgi:hypothetical protein